MRSRSLVAPLVAAIVVVGLTAACGKEPHRMAGPSANAEPVVVGVEISGPDSIPPGQSAQFTAIARLSDGTRQTAANGRWSSNTTMVRIDASGLATAGQLTGEGTLSVEVTTNGTAPEYQGARGALRSSREILILPEETYRMVGRVSENLTPAMPIFGARLEVIGGTAVVATTDADGRYRLYGVPRIAAGGTEAERQCPADPVGIRRDNSRHDSSRSAVALRLHERLAPPPRAARTRRGRLRSAHVRWHRSRCPRTPASSPGSCLRITASATPRTRHLR